MKLVIVDNHGLFMHGLAAALSQFPEVKQVFTFFPEEIGKIIHCLNEEEVHLLIVDINLDGLSGFDFAGQILLEHPDMPIAFITGHGNQINLREEAREFGAVGFFTKDPTPLDLMIQIRQAIQGEHPGLKTERKVPKLTPREKEVLHLLCIGYTNKELADELTVTPRQIERHKRNLMLKFHVNNDKRLIHKAMNYGFELLK